MVVNYAASAGAAEEVAAQIKKLGGDAIIVGANIGKREDIDRMFKEVTDKWGRVDVLVNNAGEELPATGAQQRKACAGRAKGGAPRPRAAGGASLPA